MPVDLDDTVDHPPHYRSHPSGVECIEITEHMNFNLGNAMKYLWRADEKGNAIEDLSKARWYVDRELRRREYLIEQDQEALFDEVFNAGQAESDAAKVDVTVSEITLDVTELLTPEETRLLLDLFSTKEPRA